MSAPARRESDACGCWDGTKVAAPRELANEPGLAAIAYRIGTHAAFRASLLARISSAEHAALGKRLTTRSDDDFSIALLDAWSATADVLTFYQERMAAESYLRTATERLSVLELARLIGYRLRPGVAASTYIAFIADDAPGAAPEVRVPAGQQVQSVPQGEEKPQVFETSGEVVAHAQWNAVRPRMTRPFHAGGGVSAIPLKGTSTGLKPGDAIAVVGEERERAATSKQWDFARVKRVEPDYDLGQTLVTLQRPLRAELPAHVKVYALRKRASIFGHNAPDWRALPSAAKASYLGLDDPRELIPEEKDEWRDFTIFAPAREVPAPVLMRTVEATREAVATAAIGAAEKAALEAADEAVKSASDVGKAAADAIQKAIEAAKRIGEALSRMESTLLADVPTKAIEAASAVFEQGGALSAAVEGIVKTARNKIPKPGEDPSFDNLLGWLTGAWNDVDGMLNSNTDNDVISIAQQALTNAATKASEAAKSVLDTAKEGAAATVPELQALFEQAGLLVTQAHAAATKGVQALAAARTAANTVILIKLLMALPPDQKPRDAGATADAVHAISRIAELITYGQTAVDVGVIAVVVAGVNMYTLPLGGLVLAAGIEQGDDVVAATARVKQAVDAAATEAAKDTTVPRPARRPRAEPSSDTVDLDAVYADAVPGGWLVLSYGGHESLYRIERNLEASRRDYLLRDKVSRVTLSGPDLERFAESPAPVTLPPGTDVLADMPFPVDFINVDLVASRGSPAESAPGILPAAADLVRSAIAFLQSEELEIAGLPIFDPVYGARLVLELRARGIAPGQPLAIAGKRLVLRARPSASNLSLRADGGSARPLGAEERLRVLQAPAALDSAGSSTPVPPGVLGSLLRRSPPLELHWRVADQKGYEYALVAPSDAVALERPAKEDPEVREIAFVDALPNAVVLEKDYVTLALSGALANCYERASVTVNGNVGPADHGETVREVLGSADSAKSRQRFELKHAPLTYVSAEAEGGAASTVRITVNEVQWREAGSIYGRGPEERVFTLDTDNEGRTRVEFGDGVRGARPSTGRDNVRAAYRKGMGLAGNVPADRLTTLLGAPAGLREANNPRAASGGDDPEPLQEARRNAPLTVLTLGRAVSLLDYQNFARGFAGFAKALAAWLPQQGMRGVFITVAGANGLPIADTDKAYLQLLRALRLAGDPQVRVTLANYRPATFRIALKVKRHPDHAWEKVSARVEARLRAAFSFEAREFGQPVMLSEIAAVLQQTEGVEAIDVDALYRGATPARTARLLAEMPHVSAAGAAVAAELLTLDVAPLDALEELT